MKITNIPAAYRLSHPRKLSVTQGRCNTPCFNSTLLYSENYNPKPLDKLYKNIKRAKVEEFDVVCNNHELAPIYVSPAVCKLIGLPKNSCVLETWDFDFGELTPSQEKCILAGYFAKVGHAKMNILELPKKLLPLDLEKMFNEEKLEEEKQKQRKEFEEEMCSEWKSEEFEEEEAEELKEVATINLPEFYHIRWELRFSKGQNIYKDWQEFIENKYVNSIPCPIQGKWLGVI